MLLLALLAEAQQKKPSGSPFDRPELIWGSAGLVGALLVGAVAIYLADKWRRREAMNDPDGGTELTGFRAMLERGEITKEEYETLRSKVAGRVKKTEDAPAAPPSSPPAPPVANPKPPVAGPFPPEYFEDPPK